MTFKCCKNCIIDMICQIPCEKFEVQDLQLNDLSDFNKYVRLMKKYDIKTFNLKNELSIEILYNVISIYKNGERHRDDGPAVIHANGNREWYKNGERHRDDGPAVIHANGNREWYKNGKLHRHDGPAVIYKNGDKEWYKNGKLHRDNGPAIINTNGYKAWWEKGIKIK